MNWLFTGAAVLLLVQGMTIIGTRQTPYVRWFGWLTVLLAGLSFLLNALFFSGVLVLSPEFGLLMVQGDLGRAGLGVILVGFAVAVGLGWHLARTGAKWQTPRLWLPGIGVILGLMAATQMLPLSRDDLEPLQVYAYDLGWPPLLIWLSVGTVGIGLTILRVKYLPGGAWITTLCVAILSLLVLGQETFDEPSSQWIWAGFLLAGLPANTILAIWLTLCLLRQEAVQRRSPRWWLGMIGVPLGIGLLISIVFWAALGLIDPNEEPIAFVAGLPTRELAWSVWLGWLVPLSVVSVRQLNQARKAGSLAFWASQTFIWRQALLLLALAVIAYSLVSLFTSTSLTIPVAVVIFIIAWTLVAELVANGPLYQVSRSLLQGKLLNTESPMRRSLQAARAWLTRMSARLWGGLKDLGRVSSAPVALIKVLIAIVLLIAISELPNAGETIIQPFTAPSFSKPGSSDILGPSISDRLLHELGVLSQQLQPDIIIPGPSDKEKQLIPIVSVRNASGSVDAALAKSSDVEIAGVKVPLNLLTAPVQDSMRALLGARLINGSLQIDQDNDTYRYTLLVNSSAGNTWTATSTIVVSQTISPTDLIVAQSVVPSLARELAFKIISSDPAMAALGMTQSWVAYQAFQRGLEEVQSFEAGDYDALTRAVDQFRKATLQDTSFALAHYRLGLALQSDGQPAAAIDAFRASRAANPEFASGYNTLAYSLYYFDYYYYLTAAALPPPSKSSDEIHKAHVEEARHLWQQVILFATDAASLPDRASAYYGLCRDAFDRDKYSLAYFYCQQSERLYADLSPELRSDPRIRQAEAAVLNQLGVVLISRQLEWIPEPTDSSEWHCEANTIVEDALTSEGITQRYRWDSPYSRAALEYYRRANALSPDDVIIRCNYAAIAYALGDKKPMEDLAADAAAHISLADDYRTRAKDATFNSGGSVPSSYYNLAIQEYEDAIRRNPTNTDALNGYAYTFWEWRLNWPDIDSPYGPTPAIAHQAEKYARQAVALAKDGNSKAVEAIMRSTLGEALLGQGRPHEAIEELREAYGLTPKHAGFDEIRWDLAQAILCALHNDEAADLSSEYDRSEAVHYLELIRENERSRELRPFTSEPDTLDISWIRSVCTRDSSVSVESTPDSASPLYVLLDGRPEYQPHSFCNWQGVFGFATDPDGNLVYDLKLHVWGGGIDQRIPLEEQSVRNVLLTSRPRDTHDYYFAQLEDMAGAPVSEVYPIETHSDCSKNLIILTFVRLR